MPTVSYFRTYAPDISPDRAVGVLLPFNGNASLLDITAGYTSDKVRDVKPFKLSYSTEEQAITNLVNLLLTRKGERPMQPTFGSLIPDFLFEPNTQENRTELELSVEDDVAYWLPYILVQRIDVVSREDRNIGQYDSGHNVIIEIEFKVTEIGANRTISIFTSEERINYELL